MWRFWPLLPVAALAFGCGHREMMVKPVTGFEPERYLGKWYEIARFDHRFEKGLTHVTAEYQKAKKPGRITVINRGQKETGEKTSIQGWAYLAGDEGIADLRVIFFWPFRGPYRVIALDKEAYQYAMVTSGHSLLWILARTPKLDQSVLDGLVQQAKDMGFDVSKLVYVKQEE